MLAHTPGAPVDRRVKAVLIDVTTGAAQTVLASLTNGKVEQVEPIDTRTQGQPPIMDDDFFAVDEIVKADAGWVEAMARRGLTDLDSPAMPALARRVRLRRRGGPAAAAGALLRAAPARGPPVGAPGRRRGGIRGPDRAAGDQADRPRDAAGAHGEEHNHDDPAYTGPPRTTLKPLEITQPEGPSFTVDGDVVTWDNWRLRIGFDAREGLVLYQIAYRRLSGRERPVDLPRLGGRDGGALRRPQPDPVLAELLRHRRVPASASR